MSQFVQFVTSLWCLMCLMIFYTFSLGAKTVLASCDINNTASALAMRKCGISLLKNED